MRSSSPLSDQTLFLDRNFGRLQVADALRALGNTVEVHYDHFMVSNSGEVSDVDWIRDVSARGWIILTRNGRIRNNPLERNAFIACGARVFNIRNGNATSSEIATCIRLASRKMAEIVREQQAPYIVGVSLRGDLTFIDRPNC